MRTKLIAIMAAVCFTATCFAKDIKIVVLNTDPQMHCANCESKIKNNIRFEKGIKEIETNFPSLSYKINFFKINNFFFHNIFIYSHSP